MKNCIRIGINVLKLHFVQVNLRCCGRILGFTAPLVSRRKTKFPTIMIILSKVIP